MCFQSKPNEIYSGNKMVELTEVEKKKFYLILSETPESL